MLQIEHAQRKDVPHITSLIREFAEFERLGHVCEVTEDRLEKALFREDVRTFCALASVNETYVGYALFYPVFKSFRGVHSVYLEDLYVTPEARGGGVGLELLKFVARSAAELGFSRLDWQVLKWNEPAMRFYESLGAEHYDENLDFNLTGQAFQNLIA